MTPIQFAPLAPQGAYVANSGAQPSALPPSQPTAQFVQAPMYAPSQSSAPYGQPSVPYGQQPIYVTQVINPGSGASMSSMHMGLSGVSGEGQPSAPVYMPPQASIPPLQQAQTGEGMAPPPMYAYAPMQGQPALPSPSASSSTAF
jgi:hypothetical protein